MTMPDSKYKIIHNGWEAVRPSALVIGPDSLSKKDRRFLKAIRKYKNSRRLGGYKVTRVKVKVNQLRSIRDFFILQYTRRITNFCWFPGSK